MNIKIQKFEELHKTLIETTHGEYIDNPYFTELLSNRVIEKSKEKYPDKDFKITPIGYHELVETVWDECKSHIKALPTNITSFIRNAKIYRQSPDDIKKRLIVDNWSEKQYTFGVIAQRIYNDYEDELGRSSCIDFEDMIKLAVDTLRKDPLLLRDGYDHILIDEYQDISRQRYELINELMKKNNGCKLFCVGDDWQSIMGFLGSNPEFFLHFSNYFHHPAVTYLTYNYRSIQSIVETGNTIIEHNGDHQIKKRVQALTDESHPIRVYSLLHKMEYKKQYFSQVSEHCQKRIDALLNDGYKPQDIMVLTRIYNNPLFNEVFLPYVVLKNFRYCSAHRNKGQQARVVFLLNVDEGLYGFPCELQSPSILEPARLDNKEDKEIEERRLFYVAVTRAKEDVIMYTQQCAQSKFLEEIANHIFIEKLMY